MAREKISFDGTVKGLVEALQTVLIAHGDNVHVLDGDNVSCWVIYDNAGKYIYLEPEYD